ncbi:MAG: transglutaminase domain-containing protein [Bacteroidota bacterium]
MIRLVLFLFCCGIGHLQAQVSDFEGVDFRKADSLAALYRGEDLSRLPFLTYKLTAPLPQAVEKFRAIYVWVAQNIENDYAIYLKNKKKREALPLGSPELQAWNQSLQSQVFKKLVKEQKTICTGYAYLIKEMANLVDIPCEIVDGYGRSVQSNIGGKGVANHSWNAVQLNGKWYLCDATWSSGYFQLPERKFVFDFVEGYFLAEPELFARKHYPLDEKWLLIDQAFKLEEFLNAPLIYKDAYQYQIIPQEPREMKLNLKKGESLTFKVKAPSDFDPEDLTIQKGFVATRQTLNTSFQRNEEGVLEANYTFDRLGRFDLHFVVEEATVLSYTVRVQKK